MSIEIQHEFTDKWKVATLHVGNALFFLTYGKSTPTVRSFTESILHASPLALQTDI